MGVVLSLVKSHDTEKEYNPEKMFAVWKAETWTCDASILKYDGIKILDESLSWSFKRCETRERCE
jgi:hypothetical protein